MQYNFYPRNAEEKKREGIISDSTTLNYCRDLSLSLSLSLGVLIPDPDPDPPLGHGDGDGNGDLGRSMIIASKS